MLETNPTLSPRRRKQATECAKECYHLAIDPEVKAENLGGLFDALGGIASMQRHAPMATEKRLRLLAVLDDISSQLNQQSKQDATWTS